MATDTAAEPATHELLLSRFRYLTTLLLLNDVDADVLHDEVDLIAGKAAGETVDEAATVAGGGLATVLPLRVNR